MWELLHFGVFTIVTPSSLSFVSARRVGACASPTFLFGGVDACLGYSHFLFLFALGSSRIVGNHDLLVH